MKYIVTMLFISLAIYVNAETGSGISRPGSLNITPESEYLLGEMGFGISSPSSLNITLIPKYPIAETGSGISSPSSLDIVSRPKYPPDIIISGGSFFEPSGNKELDAYETGTIEFTIENQGKGDAVDVEVRMVALTEEADEVSFPKVVKIGTIPPRISKEVSIDFTASGNIQDGKVKFRIEAVENFGFDAEPFTFSFDSRAFISPELVVADIGIDDDKEGDSYGDNNGIIELGEAIEVTVGIQNIGRGDAEDVVAKIEIGGEGENIYYGSEANVFNLSKIKSGDYKLVKFFFFTNRRYAKENLPISTEVTEKKGKYGFKKSLGLVVNKPTKRIREIEIVRREESQRTGGTTSQLRLSIDVDNIPTNSLTRLEKGICVIIGIEEYKNAPNATYANRDATVFYEYAKSVFGIPERNIYIRTNEDATKGEFDKIFGEDGWIQRRVIKDKSDVIVYFSGHGAPGTKTGEPYIVPYDGDPNYAELTAYLLGNIFENLNKLDAKSVTVFLDACFSGVSRDGDMLLADARPFTRVNIPKPEGEITVFSATSSAQISSGYREKKHGLFTYYLLKGLQENGDTDGDKKIKVTELFKYVKENVEKEARQIDREQTPTLGNPQDRVLIKLK